MKKLLLIAATFLFVAGKAQEDKTWRIGAQIGFNGNKAKFSGGMPNANARFHQNNADGSQLGLVVRYDYNKHWMGMTGIGFNSIGFSYALSENYSLANPANRFSAIKSNFVAFEIPAMIYYKFNPNCKNARWVIGGGFALNAIDKQTITKDFSKTTEGNSTNYLTSVSTAKGGGYTVLCWSVAREKMYRNGSILHAGLIVNVGLKEVATSTVNYTVDGQAYNHTFTNNGSFVGFRVAYFLKPFTSFRNLKK